MNTQVFFRKKIPPRRDTTTWQVRPWDDCLGMGNLLSVAGVHCWLLHEPQRKDRITWLVGVTPTTKPRPTKQKSRRCGPQNASGGFRFLRRQSLTKVCSFFFGDEIFGAFEFEFFPSQVSPAKSKKGAALIVQTLETITWPIKKTSWLGYLRNQKLLSYMGILSKTMQ